MLGRVADSIYWMNRYMERAENVARFVDVSLYLTLDFPDPTADAWRALVATTGDDELYAKRYGEFTMENVLRALTFDRESPNSIISSLHRARENARQVREVISSEMWEQVNKSYLMVNAAAATAERLLDAPHAFFSEVKQASQLFVGVTYLTMTHNEGWHFGRLGRLLERADKTSRIVDAKYFLLLPTPQDVGGAHDEIQWAALLKSASAFEMYRKENGIVAPARVLEFLLLHPRFPRSVRYCLMKAHRSLLAIARTDTHPGALLEALDDDFARATSSGIIAAGVHETMDGLQKRLNEIGEAVFETFVSMRRDGKTVARDRSEARMTADDESGPDLEASAAGTRRHAHAASPESGQKEAQGHLQVGVQSQNHSQKQRQS